MYINSATRTVLTAGLLALSLAGCGGGGGGDDSSSNEGGNTNESGGQTPEQTGPAYNTNHLAQIGAQSVQALGFLGEGAVVAVIDSGADSANVEFRSTTIDGFDALSNDGDRTYQGSATTDTDGHGTGVAALAIGEHVGVAPAASLEMYKVVEKTRRESGVIGGAITTENLNEALAAALEGDAQVVNISASFDLSPGSVASANQTRELIIEGIREKDWVVVLASRNNGGSTTEDGAGFADDPAFNGHVIAVSAVNSGNGIADFASIATSSNDQTYGLGAIQGVVENFIVAPGVRVCTAALVTRSNGQSCGRGISDDPAKAYTLRNGTSYAAPQVAGAAATIRAAFPNLNGREVVRAIREGATDLGDNGIDGIYGSGKLNVTAAISAAETQAGK